MLWEKGRSAILPCAGITLIRSAGLISAFPVYYVYTGPAPREPARAPQIGTQALKL